MTRVDFAQKEWILYLRIVLEICAFRIVVFEIQIYAFYLQLSLSHPLVQVLPFAVT